jgi:DNA topoisomerase-1
MPDSDRSAENTKVTPDPEDIQAAKEAGLRYVRDTRPGITREPRGKSFTYRNPDGTRITDSVTLERIRKIVIPPAWTHVWISTVGNGHIQATGRDARNRKQYRYHSRWRVHRDENKFERIIGFAAKLPAIRRRVRRDLKLQGMPREKILATVVRLLEITLIRVGNEEYARTNNSYGLTTMRSKHVKVGAKKISFSFRGKSGKQHEISVQDPQLARIVRRCQDMPGQELFCYQDAEGNVHDVNSDHVNEYLHEITNEDYTAKDFRTWAGTVLAAIALQQFKEVTEAAETKKNIVTAVEAVARMLGNTPTVCRKCYIHPEILGSYLNGETISTVQQKLSDEIKRSLPKLMPEEAAVMVLLQHRLRRNDRVKAGNSRRSKQ